MNKIYLIFIFLNSFVLNCLSQDTIYFISGDTVLAKVLEVNQNEIKYKLLNNPEGPTYINLENEIFYINFENGVKQTFNEPVGNLIKGKDSMNEYFYQKGRKDAARYYSDYKSAGTGIFITGLLLTPPIALIPAVICSVNDPSENNLGFPDKNLIKRTEYYNGYTKQAKKMKTNAVWKNFCIVTGIYIGIAILLY